MELSAEAHLSCKRQTLMNRAVLGLYVILVASMHSYDLSQEGARVSLSGARYTEIPQISVRPLVDTPRLLALGLFALRILYRILSFSFTGHYTVN